MKKFVAFLVLGIILVSFDGCDPINPPEVVKCNIFATYDANVTISPASVVINQGQSVVLDVITKAGYTSTVKVNGKVVSLTSSKLTFSDATSDSSKLTLLNVTSDMKVEATSIKLKQYTITTNCDSNEVINPKSMVVYSGASVFIQIIPTYGFMHNTVKVNGKIVPMDNNILSLQNVASDIKIEATTKEIPIDPYFLGIKWRWDSLYSRVIGGEYSLEAYDYPGEKVSYFFSGSEFLYYSGKIYPNTYTKWSVDTSTNPNILTWNGVNYKVEVRTSQKLVLSYIDTSQTPNKEFKQTFVPEP